ncbi:MAG: glycosyltransferase family 4 protein [Pseudomonadota bacterium]
MIPCAFAIPGDLATPTGGYAYARALLAASRAAGLALRHVPLPGGFPDPSAEEVAQTLATLAEAPEPALLVDGLALGALPAQALRRLPKPLIALHHHPLGLEPGLTGAESARRLATEAEALSACAAVLTTSATTARTLTDRLAVAPDRIAVAEPGVARPSSGRGDAAPRRGAPQVLGVGTLSHRKGWDVLADALARLADLPWQAAIAGADDREPAAAAALRARIEALGLAPRLRLLGAQSPLQLAQLYDGADLFVLPSRYEGYGMVVAEAMAHGLPVVTTSAGALPEAAGGAARLVPPDDAAALAEALRPLLADAAARAPLAAASRARAERFPRWEDAARTLADLLRSLQ